MPSPNVYTRSLSAIPSYCHLGGLSQNGTLYRLKLSVIPSGNSGKERRVPAREEYCKSQFSKLQKCKEIKCILQNEKASHHQIIKEVRLGWSLKICIFNILSPLPLYPSHMVLISKEEAGTTILRFCRFQVSFGMWTDQVLGSKTCFWLFCSFKSFDLFTWIFSLFLAWLICRNFLSNELIKYVLIYDLVKRTKGLLRTEGSV